MRPATVLALPLAIVFVFIGVSQVNTLQDISKPITTGPVNELWGTTTFVMLLLAMVTVIVAVAGAMTWAFRR